MYTATISSKLVQLNGTEITVYLVDHESDMAPQTIHYQWNKTDVTDEEIAEVCDTIVLKATDEYEQAKQEAIDKELVTRMLYDWVNNKIESSTSEFRAMIDVIGLTENQQRIAKAITVTWTI